MSKDELRRFVSRRAYNILPLYLIIEVYHLFVDQNPSLWQKILLMPMQLGLVQSHIGGTWSFLGNDGMWFISCIFFCYAFYPFIQKIIQMASPKFLFMAFAALCLLSIYLPIAVNLSGFGSIYSLPFYRLIEFVEGCLLAQLIQRKDFCVISKHALCMAVVLTVIYVAALTLAHGAEYDYLFFNMLTVPFFMLLLVLLYCAEYSHKARSPRVLSVTKYLASLSFVFYMVQSFRPWVQAEYIIGLIHYDSNLLRIGISFFICLFTSIIVNELVNKPVRKLLERKLG